MKYGSLILLLTCVPLLAQNGSLDAILNPAQLPMLKPSRLVQVSSYDTTGGNNDRINIHPGKTAVILDETWPGVITRIWVTIDSRDPHFLRRILLKVYWDGETEPSVEVPVGDFFGTGFEYTHYISRYLGMTSGGYYCYFPMPFKERATIEVVNETGQEIFAFYYHIDIQKLKGDLPENTAYFHAQWRREIRTESGRNYTVLEAEGRGHFVGLNMSMQGYHGGLGFLEGDEMVYVDGENFPSVYGTGTEDYFTSGWYFRNGEFAAPYHGLMVKDDSLGRIAAYRFHSGDAIPFEKSIRFTMEHGHDNSEICDYASTAFWYQMEPHKPFPAIPAASLRIPLRIQVVPGGVEGEDLKVTVKRGQAVPRDMSRFGAEWSGLKQNHIAAGGPGTTWKISIPGLEEHAYDADIIFTRGPDYGNVEIIKNDKTVTRFSGYHHETLPSRKVRISHIPVKDGCLTLAFRIAGKDSLSSGFDAGIDALLLHPVRTYIPEWHMIGPFPNPRDSDILRYGLDTVYPPEKELKLNKTYTGVEGQTVSWTREKTPDSGYMSLWQKYTPYEMVIAYALTWVYSPKSCTVPLLLGSDDGVKVFCNGREIHRFLDVRIAVPDQDRIELNLKKGWNSLLLKLENNFGGYAFYARLLDRDRSLTVSADRKR